MNRFVKQITSGMMCLTMCVAIATAQPPAPPHDMHQSPSMAMASPQKCPPMPCVGQSTLQANKICPIPDGFVLIDSVDNAIDIVKRSADTLYRIGRHQVDIFRGRHDLHNIMRPSAIQVAGDKIVFLATTLDSSFVGVLPIIPCDTLPLLARVGIASHSNVMGFDPMNKELVISGFNPTGYDITIINIKDGIENIANSTPVTFHYHVPKQAERIQASDPYGVGLTAVAVMVVFFALMLIALVLKGFGKIITHIRKQPVLSPFARRLSDAVTASDSDVYAAIAVAIHLYEEEMHDEEDNVLTIQKVERAWTPWNAKFYNMNRYFNIKGR